MNQYDYLNNDYNNFEEKIFINNDKEITEDINQSESNDISQLEKDICILINYLRTNPIDYCNNIIKKKRYNNQEEMKLVYLLEDIHNKNEVLQPYIRSPEISSAARYLLDNIVIYYRKYHNLNLKNLDQNCLNLRTRLSNYGQRTGRIFETVLFKMDNPDDIVNHILMEEKGRNMLLSYKMKYIGVACNYVTSNLICSVIDIVQEFIPYKDLNSPIDLNNNNNEVQNIVENNGDNHSYNYNKKNYGNMKKKYLYNQNNNESISLLNNLKEEKIQNYSNKRKGKSLKIIKVTNNNEINKNINNNNNENKANNKNEQDNNNKKKEIYNSPDRKLEGKKNNDMCYTPDINNQNPNETKRSNINNIRTLNQKAENNNNEKNENLDNNRFTMAGRTFKQQQEIIENSKRNLTKSKSVCSYDLRTINSKSNNSKNKFQRLKHEEKMEILHKINHRDSKTRNSQSPSEENIKGLTQQISNFTKNNNYEYNFDNKSGKSPGRSICNQDNYDLCSENEKINIFNNMNKGADGGNQTFTDIKSNPGMEMNEEYSRNKINEIKNDLKNQIKRELRDEVREEIRNEFNKKLYKNQQREPIIIDIENYDNRSLKSNNIYYNNNEDKRNTYDGAELNERIYYNNNNGSNYYDKKRGKTRWSSIQKYYYIKNNNNINNINNTNIYVPDNISQYSKNTTYNNYRGRKSFDWKDFRNNNDYNNDNGMELKEQYKQKYEQFTYMPNNNLNDINNNDYINNQDIIRPDSYKNNKDINNSFFNQGFKQRNRQEIKKLIKLYNLAKDDQRNKSINYNNNNAYNIINNNKSISNTFFPQNNNNNNNSINDNTQNNININNNNEINNNNGNDYIMSYENNANNNFINNRNNLRKNSNNYVNYNINNNEEENSIENDFVKGHRFQIKYQKVKPKGQIYSKSGIPRNISVKNINNLNINSRKNIKEIPISINSNKSEDMVNLNNNSNNYYDNKNSNYEKEDKEDINSKDNNFNKGKDYIIEKKIYKKNYNEIKTYDAESNKNNIEDINSDINSIINEKLSMTGRFLDDNNNINSEKNSINAHNTIDIKNYMDKNIIYKESRDKPIISKSEKMEDNNVVTTITTKTREIFTPDRKKNPNDEYVVKRKAYKNQSDLIKEYKKYEKINNGDNYNNNYDINEVKSSDGSKRDNLYNNKIRTKKLSFGGRTTFDRNLYYNKNIYADLDDNNMETNKYFKTGFQYEQNNFDNYSNLSPRFNYDNNLTSKTTSYYKKKKYIPYPYYPYEYKNNYNEFLNQPRNIQNKNESLEKKYIKDPEGNLIETYVKKTKFNDGSVLIEYE